MDETLDRRTVVTGLAVNYKIKVAFFCCSLLNTLGTVCFFCGHICHDKSEDAVHCKACTSGYMYFLSGVVESRRCRWWWLMCYCARICELEGVDSFFSVRNDELALRLNKYGSSALWCSLEAAHNWEFHHVCLFLCHPGLSRYVNSVSVFIELRL